MADDNVIADITREIKTYGDNVKALQDSMQRDLAEVRRVADEAKGAANRPEVKAQIDALTASVAEKHASIEAQVAQVKQIAEDTATAMRRTPRGADDAGSEVKEALAFYTAAAANAGTLKVTNRPTETGLDMDGYQAFKREFESYLRKGEQVAEAKALSVGADPDGGYLVPTAVSTRILSIVQESSPLRALATVETIGTGELEIPVDDEEFGAGWVGETADRPSTGTANVGTAKIVVHEIYAKPKATQKLLDDASVNIEQWIGRKIGERFARVEAAAFITGDGVNKPRGILTYAAAASEAAMARGRVLQVKTGNATLITADGLITLSYSLKEPYLANASWLMKRTSVGAVAILKDQQGQYIWRPGLEAGRPSTLLGYPVRMANDMPVVGAGALPVAFGDFRAAYTIVDRQGITTLRDPYSAKPFVEFYSRKRVGGDVVNFEAYALQVVST